MRAPLLRRKDPVEQRYVQRIIEHCREVGVFIRTKPARSLSGKMKFTGCYDGDGIYIARNNPFWFEILVHEYQHMKQDLEKTVWFEPQAYRYWTSLDNWLAKKTEPSDDRILDCARFIAECELDCERRTLDEVRKNRFSSLDPSLVIIRANAYIWEYEAMRLTRKVASRRRPYKVPEILAVIPSDRLMREDQIGKLPDGYLVNYIRHCAEP